jgi:hypothetical protein
MPTQMTCASPVWQRLLVACKTARACCQVSQPAPLRPLPRADDPSVPVGQRLWVPETRPRVVIWGFRFRQRVIAAPLRKALIEYEDHFNAHRPHRALNHASPLRALPDPVDADIKVTRRDRVGGLLHEYSQVA